MIEVAAHEEKLLRAIAKEMDKLDETLGKMEETESKIKHFIEQEKALHEIKKIIRKEHKLEKIQDKDVSHEINDVVNYLEKRDSLIFSINQ